MQDVTIQPHEGNPHLKKVFMGDEHIANVEHKLRPVYGANQATFQPVFIVHPPEDKPDHFEPKTCNTLHLAKHCALLSSLQGEMRNLKVK